MDDPKKPEFASWDSFHDFVLWVRHTRRYIPDKKVQAFLDTVLATLKDRDMQLSRGMVLYRAQQGVRYEPIKMTIVKS